ncbi:MAG: SusD/RagB family nutrient-binding outer membrane lipoprotein, partial [Ekhidna sp.]
GTTSGDQFADFSAPDANTVINADADVILISGYESLFLQAEAAERGWGTGDPKSLYDQAVMASFSFHGLNGSALVSPGGNYEYDGELSTIYYQKWLAFNGKQGFEGWNEWRRTGVPDLSPSIQGQPLPNIFPLRLIWPANETATNPNVPELEALDAPVWWDKTF